MSLTIRILIAAVTAVFTWLAYWATAEYFESAESEFIATALLGSIVIHEFGHLIAFKRHGISSVMFFAVAFAGVVPLGEKHQRLNDSVNTEIAMAGVFGNIAGACIGLGLGASDILTWEEGLRIVNLNAGLILWNLIPFGNLDGGRVAKILFNSIEEQRDAVYVWCMVGVVAVGFCISAYFGHVSSLPAFLLVHGIRKRSLDDDPHGSRKPTALNARQQCLWARTYVFTATAGMVALAVTPHII